MSTLKQSLENLIQNKKYIEAIGIIDKYVLENNEFLVLRALLRELVNDLDAARIDIENYNGKNKLIKDLTQARILAKLGYIDESKNILKDYSLISTPFEQIDSEGIPFTLGLIYCSFDLERLGIYRLEDVEIKFKSITGKVLYHWIIDTLLRLGAFKTLAKIVENFEICNKKLKNLINDLYCYDSLPNAEDTGNKIAVIKEKLEGVRGWLSIEEGLQLVNLARSIDNCFQIVEIGSFHGRSTICLAYGSLEGKQAQVYAVDPHNGVECYGDNVSLNSLKRNLMERKLDANVDIFVDSSLSVAKRWRNGKVGLLFIDALHDYESVKNDFLAWSKYLFDGSIVAFHDSVQPGVNRFVLEILNDYKDFEPLGLRDSLFVFRKSRESYNNEKSSFFYSLLEKRGFEYNKWIQRDFFTVQNFSLSLLKEMRI